jgi:hypothetical protein
VLFAPAAAASPRKEKTSATGPPNSRGTTTPEPRAPFDRGLSSAGQADAPDVAPHGEIVLGATLLAVSSRLTTSACAHALEAVAMTSSPIRVPVAARLDSPRFVVQIHDRAVGAILSLPPALFFLLSLLDESQSFLELLIGLAPARVVSSRANLSKGARRNPELAEHVRTVSARRD